MGIYRHTHESVEEGGGGKHDKEEIYQINTSQQLYNQTTAI